MTAHKKPLAWRVEQRTLGETPGPWKHHSTHPRMSTATRVAHQRKPFRERRIIALVPMEGER
ncbi:hypothetical protein [Thiohalocapsa marina]|uniref:hypothetical protein n=1 Tax=Thiohalocapsa marina TaxID=424902 RepID=UPI0036D8DF28